MKNSLALVPVASLQLRDVLNDGDFQLPLRYSIITSIAASSHLYCNYYCYNIIHRIKTSQIVTPQKRAFCLRTVSPA